MTNLEVIDILFYTFIVSALIWVAFFVSVPKTEKMQQVKYWVVIYGSGVVGILCLLLTSFMVDFVDTGYIIYEL